MKVTTCLLVGLGLAGALLASGCASDGAAGAGEELTLAGQVELFPELDFSTGLVPAGSPVQASFSVSAKGDAKVTAVAVATGSASSPGLAGVPGKGAVSIDGDFALVGELKVDVSGLPSYDGPIPGLDDVKIPVHGTTSFDPFAVGSPVALEAAIPPTKLPPIPLPGGIPGKLVIEIAKGSTVNVTFRAACAGADGHTATYDGEIERGGTLVLAPTIEIDVPIVGTQSFPIPAISVDLALGSSPLEASAPIHGFGDAPAGADVVHGACGAKGGGGGGGGQGGGGSVGGGDGTGGGSEPGYPTGPYGATTGAILADHAFQVFVDPQQDATPVTVRLSDFYDPTGKASFSAASPFAGRPKPRALLIAFGAAWAPPSKQEITSTLVARYGRERILGGDFLLDLVEGPTAGTAASASDVLALTQPAGATFPCGFDPPENAFFTTTFQGTAFPTNVIVDTTSMRIVTVALGEPDDAFWSLFEATAGGS